MGGLGIVPVGRLRSRAGGFTLIETIFAISILTFGLLALGMALLRGALHASTSSSNLMARAKAAEAVETVFVARDTRILTWAQIRNVEDGGVFLSGALPLRTTGPDGLVNTADDGQIEVLTEPGADGIIGTADDPRRALTEFTRQIEITDSGPNLRQIRVVVQFQVGALTRRYELVTLISSFA